MDPRNQSLWKRTYLVVIDLRKQSIVYLDSMCQKGKNICETIFQSLQNESKTRRNIELDPVEWKQYSLTSQEIPQQLNGSDCGMFTCKYADYVSRDQPVTFSQQHMPLFRKRMVWEILLVAMAPTPSFSIPVSNIPQDGGEFLWVPGQTGLHRETLPIIIMYHYYYIYK